MSMIKCDVCGKEYEESKAVAKFTLDGFENFCPDCDHKVQMAALDKAFEIYLETEKKKGEIK